MSELKTLPLDQILLDPNNYRFRDQKAYKRVEQEDIHLPSIQKRTQRLLTGKGDEKIRDLVKSFKSSGFLPVDQIQVQKITIDGEEKYLVIEGNRRIATLKYLRQRYEEEHIDLGKLAPSIFDNVPVVPYDGSDETHYYVLMGLNHISGKQKWPLVNQARLMKKMIDSGMSEREVTDAIGITLHRLKRSLRALALVDEYKKSDFGDQFEADMFNVFDTAVNATSIKAWLGWDDDTYDATNKDNLKRFFSWISKNDVFDDDYDVKDVESPIINTGRDVRDIAKFIDDEEALDFMEESRSVTEAYLSSDKMGKDKFDTTLNALEKNINTAIQFSTYANESHAQKFENIYKKIKGLIASQDLTELLLPKNIKPKLHENYPDTKHFSELHIKQYKGYNNLEVPKLNKINLFAGANNVGKTSLLEAIRLLIIQNDANDYLALQQLRGKFAHGKMPPHWIIENFTENTYGEEQSPIKILGKFDDKDISIQIERTDNIEADKSTYLGSLSFKGSYRGITAESLASFFERKENAYQIKSAKIYHLCPFAYVSPFSGYWNNKLFDAHAKNTEKKTYQKVIGFLREHIDPSISDIELTEKNNLKRFLVDSKSYKTAVDLSHFGDGVQHIFRTTLQFALAENGVILIDEIEAAIHHSLMIEFSKFIQELAESFNVQVFITSHSGECINAFVENGYSNDKISMYHLTKDNEKNKIECLHISGERYKEIYQKKGLDLRES